MPTALYNSPISLRSTPGCCRDAGRRARPCRCRCAPIPAPGIRLRPAAAARSACGPRAASPAPASCPAPCPPTRSRRHVLGRRPVRSRRAACGPARAAPRRATVARYVLGTSNDGCINRCASSPSLVSSIRPSVSASSRPTWNSFLFPRTRCSTRSPTHGLPRSSDIVECIPRGLLIAKCTRVSSTVTRAPSTRITDASGSTRVPSSVTIRSSTSTRPSRIIFSATRRDAIPACDNTFCRRTPSASAISVLVYVE